MVAGRSEPSTQPQREPRELVVTRVFDAPRELVFEVWSKPEHLVHWWGPKGFTLPTSEMDFRPGGAIRFCMRSPGGQDYWMRGSYVDIVAPSHIAFTSSIDDDPSHQVLTKVTFTEQDGKTTVTVHQTFDFESDATRGAPKGWNESLDRMRDYLPRARS